MRRPLLRYHWLMGAQRVGREEPTAALVGARLEKLAGQVEQRAEEVRRDEPGGVHQMRVTVRRLRSLLVSYRRLLDRQRTEPLRAELAWLGDLLGEARDAEVVLSRLLLRLEANPDRRGVDEAAGRAELVWRGRYRDAHDELVAALGSERYRALLADLTDLAADPPFRGRAAKRVRRVVPELLRRDVDRLRRRMADLPDPTDPGHVEQLHAARKAAKRVRYAAEVTRPAYGKDAKRLVRAMKRFSDQLGHHHDVSMAREAVAELVEDSSPDAAFAWGRVDEVEARSGDEMAREVPAYWRRARRSLDLDDWAP